MLSDGDCLIKHRLSILGHAQDDFAKCTSFGNSFECFLVVIEYVGLGDARPQTFIHKGMNDRWRDILNKDDVLIYEQRAKKELGEECAHWLTTGGEI